MVQRGQGSTGGSYPGACPGGHALGRLLPVLRVLVPVVLLVLAVSPWLAVTRAAEDDVITVHPSWEPRTIGSAPTGRIPFRGEPPAGVMPLPDLQAPRYARIRMAGDTKGLLIALDATPGAPRLWVDHLGWGLRSGSLRSAC